MNLKYLSEEEFKQISNIIKEEFQKNTIDNPIVYVDFQSFSNKMVGIYLDNVIIGIIKTAPFVRQTSLEIYILPEYRGNGITTKLQTIELELAKKLDFDYIISMAHPNNIGSCKTLEKVGLNFVKETRLPNGFLRKLYMLKLK